MAKRSKAVQCKAKQCEGIAGSVPISKGGADRSIVMEKQCRVRLCKGEAKQSIALISGGKAGRCVAMQRHSIENGGNMKIREYSPLWWAKKGLAGAGLVAVLALTGLGDAPATAAEEPITEPKVVNIEYIPAEPEYLGEFTITAYCGCPICCGEWSSETPMTASGEPAVEGVTVGAYWGTIPAGTVIEIEGVGERVVQDKPAGWIIDKYDGKIIDLYFNDHQAALAFGKRTAKVWISLEEA